MKLLIMQSSPAYHHFLPLRSKYLGSTHILSLFGMKENCHSNGCNVLLYLFVTKLTAVIIEEVTIANYIQK
jgi:hypothetical protein